MTLLDQPTATAELFDAAQGCLAGGVGASARLNPALGRPVYLRSAYGPRLETVDGETLLDFNMSLGSALLGHGSTAVVNAVTRVLQDGIMCSHETPAHVTVARELQRLVPCAERVRFANSGTEANGALIRLARACTGRSRILKFEGHFHGLGDTWMFNTNAPPQPLVDGAFVPLAPESAGIPASVREDLVVVPWNDADAFRTAMARHGGELAAVLCEPVNYNSGCIPPQPGFLELLRELTTAHGALLLFDEILSGFRMAVGGAQAYYGVTPDACTLGKAIGNGIPVAAIVGREEVMRATVPQGRSAHSGTYTGHPIAIAAVGACLELLGKPAFHERLDGLGARLCDGLARIFADAGVPVRIQRLGARLALYFGIEHEVRSFRDTTGYDADLAIAFARATFEEGVHFHSYGHIALGHHGISGAHSESTIDEGLERVERAVRKLRSS